MKIGNRKVKLAISLAIVTAISMGTVSANAASSAPKEVDLSGYTLTVADSGGLFKVMCAAYSCDTGADYKINWVTFATGPEALAAAVGGSVQMASTGMAPAVFAAAAKQPVKIVAVTAPQRTPGALFSLVVSKKAFDAGVTTMAGLRGKSLALSMGTEGEYLAIVALKKAQVPLTSVAFNNLGPAAAMSALNTGAVGAAVLVEPFLSMAKAAGAQVLATGNGNLAGYFAFWQSTKTMKNPKAVAATNDLLVRWQKMYKQFSIDRTGGIAIFSKTFFPTYPAAVATPLATVLYDGSVAGFAPIDDVVIKAFQDEADVMYQVGNIKRKLNMANWFDAKLYEKTLKALPKVK